MKSTLSVLVVAKSAALGLILSSTPQSTLAAGPCDRPVVGGEARACAARQEGPTALRRFILRTEMIYGLSYRDFEPAQAAALAAQRPRPSGGSRNDAVAMALANSIR
jgi:hypothetical protein